MPAPVPSNPVVTHLAVFSVGFCVGLLVGWYFSGEDFDISKRSFRRLVAIAITLLWGTTLVADITITTYSVPVYVHALMGGVAGYLFSEDGVTLNLGGMK